MGEFIKELEETFKDVTDVTEPGNLDKILMILEQRRIEDDEYMQLLVCNLKNEVITWVQPWYQENCCLTRKPPPQEHRELDIENYLPGPFTKEEGELVEKNWQNFVLEYEVPDTPIRLARWKNLAKSKNLRCSPEEAVRKYVIAYLAQGLQRNLYQVYKYFAATYGNPVKFKHYTQTEERIMEICFYHRPQDACMILPLVLGREPRGIYKKFTEYFNGPPEKKKKLKWNLQLASKLVSRLMEYSGCTFDKLKNKQFDQSVWQKIEEEIGQQYKYIQAFWYGTLHVQLYAKCAIKTKSLRKIIFKKLRTLPCRIWSDIRWKQLAMEFPDGFTHVFLYKTAHVMFREYPNYLTSPLPTVLAQALEDTRHRRRRRLKTIDLINGKLEYAMHDISLKRLMKGHT